MSYTISKTLRGDFKEVINKVTEELRKEGFGIISEVDMKEKFREKLDIDFRNYTILGACNPKLAHEAISKESRIGVMLPCNILVQDQEEGTVDVSAVNPLTSIGSVKNAELESIAEQVNGKLKKVMDNL